MKTRKKGFIKYHKGCKYNKGGQAKYIENLNYLSKQEWDLICIACGKELTEDDIEIVKI